MCKGNTEGTSQPEDSVESRRRESVDWRNNLRKDYEETGMTFTQLTELYGVSSRKLRAEMTRQSISVRPRGVPAGYQRSEKWRKASAKHWNDPEWLKQQRERWLERSKDWQISKDGSPFEDLLHQALKKANISFSTQKRLLGKYVVDILVTQKPVVIEADSLLHERSKISDQQRDAELRNAGYEVFRFTNDLIGSDPDSCIHQVIDSVGLVPEASPEFTINIWPMGPDSSNWTGGEYEWVCVICSKKFRAHRNHCRDRILCSRECVNAWLKTDEGSERISQGLQKRSNKSVD